jgi:hypothetical protein
MATALESATVNLDGFPGAPPTTWPTSGATGQAGDLPGLELLS